MSTSSVAQENNAQILPTQILNAPENYSLLETLKEFSALLAKAGIKIAVSSPRSLMELNNLTPERKKQIEDAFRLSIQWLGPVLNEPQIGEFKVSVETEKKALKNALSFYRLRVSDDFLDTIQEDHLVEIYSAEGKQIYRGLNFYKYTGYSLLDVSVFEWFVLWERPKLINQMMFEQSMTVVKNDLPLYRFQIPRHVSRETLNTEHDENFVPRACVVEFLHCGSLKSLGGEFEGGIICTARGGIIAEGDEALDIEFV